MSAAMSDPEVSRTALILSLAGLCCLNLIASIDATALSVSIPTIASALHATTVEAYWAGTAFVLSSAVAQPIIAAFSNAFGRKTVVLAAIVVFTVGTIVCGTSHHVSQLIAGRTIQGLGGGGMLTMTYVVMADLLDIRGRAKAMSLISLVWLVGSLVGPVMGGGFSGNITWRWIFFICLPFCAAGLVLITFFLHTPHKALQPVQALQKVDWVGAILFVGSLTGFLIALSWGGTMFAWHSWHTIVPLVVGGVGLLAWLGYERYVPAAPIMPLAILGNRTAVAGFMGTIFLGIIQFAMLYYLPLYYQLIKGYPPIISGVALLPIIVMSGPTTIVTGMMTGKTGNYRWMIWAGWSILALGTGLLVLLDSATTVPQWIFITGVSGIGLGALFQSQSTATQAVTDEKHMAIASGLTPFFRTIGQALGIVVGNTIFQNVFEGELKHATSTLLREQAGELALEAAGLEPMINSLASGSVEKRELLAALSRGLQAVWYSMMGFALAAAVLSLVIRQRDLGPGRARRPVEAGTEEEAREEQGEKDAAPGSHAVSG